jgi:hypothetical protein
VVSAVDPPEHLESLILGFAFFWWRGLIFGLYDPNGPDLVGFQTDITLDIPIGKGRAAPHVATEVHPALLNPSLVVLVSIELLRGLRRVDLGCPDMDCHGTHGQESPDKPYGLIQGSVPIPGEARPKFYG